MKAQEMFWIWFLDHEDELYNINLTQDEKREDLFNQLSVELSKVDINLTFELGPQEYKREFIISAAGIKRAFPTVLSLVEAAPTLERWTVIPFRPRRPVEGFIRFRNKCIDTKEVQFTLLDNGKTPGIYLFMPGYLEEDSDLKQIGYLLLDQALGENDVEYKLGLIKMYASESRTEGNHYPLVELPVLFDQLVVKLEGRN